MNFDIEVNNKKIEARKGDTILAALSRNGINIPTLCNLKGLSPTGACRICVVEVDGFKNLVASCSYPVEEGMRILTHSPRVIKARKTLVELLLSNHPDDCLYCERNNNCELQNLASELNIRERRISGKKSRHKIDVSSPSIVKDLAKCILCGRCIRTCDEIQSVSALEFLNRGNKTIVGTTMNQNLNFSSCIACGQCVICCPTAALRERSNLEEVQDALNNKSLKVVVQIDPTVSISLGEEFGLKPGRDIGGIITAALRKIGFDFIFDTGFAADISAIETAAELKSRIESGKNLPLITSNCPAWVKYAEQFYPDIIPLLSNCKSPQQIMGSIISSYFAPSVGINPNSLFTVSVSPCLAKKFEAQRVEMTSKGVSDVDVVLSTRELARLIRLFGIDLQNTEPQQFDTPFGLSSSSGKLFSVVGGTSEAIIRTYYNLITGKELTSQKTGEFRPSGSIKHAEVKVGKDTIKVSVANGLSEIHRLISDITSGENSSHLIEVMACPSGCTNGGGQPFGTQNKGVKTRSKSIYEIDEAETLKHAHKNPFAKDLYSKYLGSPNGDKYAKLFCVNYSKREVLL